MNNENKNMSRRQTIKGMGAVALGTAHWRFKYC